MSSGRPPDSPQCDVCGKLINARRSSQGYCKCPRAPSTSTSTENEATEAQYWRLIRDLVHELDAAHRGIGTKMGDHDVIDTITMVLRRAARQDLARPEKTCGPSLFRCTRCGYEGWSSLDGGWSCPKCDRDRVVPEPQPQTQAVRTPTLGAIVQVLVSGPKGEPTWRPAIVTDVHPEPLEISASIFLIPGDAGSHTGPVFCGIHIREGISLFCWRWPPDGESK